MSSSADRLISHVQDLLNPSDHLPGPPSTAGTSDASLIDEGHPRPSIPEWLPRNGPESPSLGPNEEIVYEADDDSDEDLSGVADKVAGDPIDVHAYYLPFHFYREWWGVYVKAGSVMAIAAHLERKKWASKVSAYPINAVLRTLIEHEVFHHRVELACTRAELPLLDFLRRTAIGRGSPYEWYFGDAKAGLHEEAMANANAMRELVAWQDSIGLQDSVHREFEAKMAAYMETQPPGYQDFGKWKRNREFSEGQDLVIKNFLERSFLEALSAPPDGLIPGRRYFTDRSVGSCPIYLVLDRGTRSIRRVLPFPKEFGMRIKVHTEEHPPPHFHLERPIGTEYGKYKWPELEPVKGSPKLSRSLRRDLDNYLARYGNKIARKIDEVYTRS